MFRVHQFDKVQSWLPGMGYRARQAFPRSICACQAMSKSCADLCARRTCPRRAIVPARWRTADFRPRNWPPLRPGLVYVSLSAFGHTGPWASRRGFDTVVQTVSGMMIPPGGGGPGRDAGAPILPGLGHRLLHRLPDGVWRNGSGRAPRAGKAAVGSCASPLPRSAKSIADRGEVPAAALKDVPVEFSCLEHRSMVSHTPSGSLRHLKPVVQLSETQPRWTRPSVPLGYHRPEWPSAA